MRKLTISLCLAALAVTACSTVAPPAAVDAQVLVGSWAVDLRPRPDAPAYTKELVITEVKGGTFEGMFYDSTITEGRVNTAWGAVRLAFITSDGQGFYYHSATLNNGRLEGLSNVPHRRFLAYWSAAKQALSPALTPAGGAQTKTKTPP